MKKSLSLSLLKYIYIVSITMVITTILILNSLSKIYAYDILENNDKTINVVIASSYNYQDEQEQQLLEGLYHTLEKLKPKDLDLNMEYESLDKSKISNKEYLDSFNKLLNTKYNDKDIDVVFTIGDDAFNFARQQVLKSESILYHKQIISIGLNRSIKLSKEEKEYMMCILSSNKEPLWLNIILYLQDNIDAINIILDKSEYSKDVKSRIRSSQNVLYRDIKINFIESNYIEEIKEELRKVNQNNQANIIVGSFISKDDKSYISPDNVVTDIKSITKNSIYTYNYEYINTGVIGGYVNIPEKQGEYAAKKMYSMINGDNNKENVIEKIEATFIFDYKEIYKYKLDTFRIPEGSLILNKPKFALLLPRPLKVIVCIIVSLIIIVGVYGVYKFIKEKQKSKQNKQLYERTKEREKLKTDFIVNMSHELRTPLNVILSTSKVTELKINKNDYDNKYLLEKLEQINKNSNRLLKLVNNLIDITKFELGNYELKLENLNIVEVVENIVLASVDYSTCKQIDLVFDTEEEEIITAIDEDKIERAILNLLSNAIKFTRGGGSIYVYIKREKNKVFISVEDNGIGIPKDKLNEIFNRFYQVSDTLKKYEEGSGIGLCIVKEIINLHRGKINVYSQVNKGTKFEIILPIYTVEKNLKNLQTRDVGQIVKLEMSDVDTKEK